MRLLLRAAREALWFAFAAYVVIGSVMLAALIAVLALAFAIDLLGL